MKTILVQKKLTVTLSLCNGWGGGSKKVEAEWTVKKTFRGSGLWTGQDPS